MPDPTAPTGPQPARVPPSAPATRVTDEVTPFDLHGPGKCGHGPDCRGQWGEKDGRRAGSVLSAPPVRDGANAGVELEARST